MAPSKPSLYITLPITLLHLTAFALSIAAERRRSTATEKPDEYDEQTFCQYDSDVSSVYALVAFLLLVLSHVLLNAVTRCFCCHRGLTVGGGSRIGAVFFFVATWVMFLGAEACLLAGATRNAYHTKYRGMFGRTDLSCAALRKGVFTAAAVLVLLNMTFSLLFYFTYVRANTGGWQKYQSEGVADVGMSSYDQREKGIGKN